MNSSELYSPTRQKWSKPLAKPSFDKSIEGAVPLAQRSSLGTMTLAMKRLSSLSIGGEQPARPRADAVARANGDSRFVRINVRPSWLT